MRREGSGSDGGSDSSLEEISADDFRPRNSGVWVGYPSVPRSFGQDLYSFAWAQAVQNKPLGFDIKPAKKEEEEMVFEVDDDDEVGGEEMEMEKEEGELEEGEIELGSESVTMDGAVKIKTTECETEKKENNNLEVEEEEVVIIGEFDQSVGTILEELETITVEEAEASFEAVCSRLQKSFASLKKMFSQSARVPVLDALVQQAFMGIQTVYGVYSLGNLKKMEENRELLLRLLIHIKNQYSVFLSAEQVKEIDERVQSLASESVNVEKPGNVRNLNGFTNAIGLVPATRGGLDYRTVNHGSSNNSRAAFPKLEQSINMRKVEFSPLLNLHADYDEDSLPSPTRDNAPPLPTLRPIGFGTEIIAQPTQPITPKNVESGNGSVHPYVADAFKEVSSYQQKYGRNSILTSNQLPSPTPSEDGNDGGDDSDNEVSSSSVGNNVRTVGFSSSRANINSGSQIAPAKPVEQMGLGPNAVINTSAKSRDPRLRFTNAEVGGAPQNGVGGSVNSKKNKAGDEPLADANTFKRQRNGLSRDLQLTTGSGGWIEDGGPFTSQMGNRIRPNEDVSMEIRKPGNGVNANMNSKESSGVNANMKSKESNSGSVPKPAASPAPSVSLPSLLKDIAVNPTMLLQLVKREQQRLAAEAQQKTANPKLAADSRPKSANLAVNGLPFAVPSADNASTKPLEVGQNPVMKPQTSSQSTSMNAQNDVGKIRMKARDPRRILHSNLVQKTDTMGSETPKTSGALVPDVQNNKVRITVREQGEQIQTTNLASQSTPLPDIARQFNKNLKNVADIVSTSESTAPLPAGLQNISQPVPSKITDDSSDPLTFSGTSSQGGGTCGSSQSVNPWGDVDHLLDGYDDQQRAAIQKERARRIAEQNKMFSEKKLCLVLDLDHTLLNSAKFIEVDPVHEEILRIKEEQDREKRDRHLFRFQHMGMWTKLRPGVWKFLEKASKLFELHLYTMGNKLYATEMAKVLDPTGALFSGRVISKGDDGDPLDGDDRIPKSKDLEGVLGMESAVVIIDDSVRVWPHHKLNLIVVERYTFFPCSRRQFGLPGPSLLEIDHDERPEEATLASALGVIERIHHNFFSHPSLNEVDVRNILASEQRKILAGCKIVFSRVFPVGEAKPHLHPLWQTAEQFGAECTNQIDEKVTHVVANSLGTDKVNWALSTGRFVVHPGWVEASALLYRRASEQDFAVKV